MVIIILLGKVTTLLFCFSPATNIIGNCSGTWKYHLSLFTLVLNWQATVLTIKALKHCHLYRKGKGSLCSLCGYAEKYTLAVASQPSPVSFSARDNMNGAKRYQGREHSDAVPQCRLSPKAAVLMMDNHFYIARSWYVQSGHLNSGSGRHRLLLWGGLGFPGCLFAPDLPEKTQPWSSPHGHLNGLMWPFERASHVLDWPLRGQSKWPV